MACETQLEIWKLFHKTSPEFHEQSYGKNMPPSPPLPHPHVSFIPYKKQAKKES